MRAVCTRGRLEGDENGHGCMRTHEGRVEGRSFLFLHATAERIHPRAKKLYYFGGKILFRPSANPSFVSFFPFFFFFKPTTLFSGPRLPTGKGWKPRGREGRNRSSFAHPRFSARLVIISRYYPACILQFCCCSRAIALAIR